MLSYWAGVASDDRVVGRIGVPDTMQDDPPVPVEDPYTPEILAEIGAVRSVSVPTKPRPGRDKMDGGDNLVPDPVSEQAGIVRTEDAYFDRELFKAALRAVVDVTNIRLVNLGEAPITGAEVKAAFKARRGH